MKNGIKALVIACSSLLVACGSPGDFKGKVDDRELSVEDAVFLPLKDDAGKTLGVMLYMVDQPDICSTLKANRDPKNTTVFSALLVRSNGEQVLAPEEGDYTVTNNFLNVGSGNHALAIFGKNDANCDNAVSGDRGIGRSGIINVKELALGSDGAMSGTFDITFGSQGDKVSGSFNAAYCDVNMESFNPNCE